MNPKPPVNPTRNQPNDAFLLGYKRGLLDGIDLADDQQSSCDPEAEPCLDGDDQGYLEGDDE